MKKLKKLLLVSVVTIMGLGVISCKDDNKTPVKPVLTSSDISGNITKNTKLTADKKWILKGYVFVKDGVTLTIEPGTVIAGDKATKGTLIIERGGKIMAEGTAQKPIVFTSNMEPGKRNPGDWGGIVICGKALNNQGAEIQLEGEYGAFYGGNDDKDNSGVLKYIRIEYAGIPIQPNKEINSLTMASVGSGTVIENIQCSFGGDDSFEWFGGTVNCKNLVSFSGWDDDFDCDFGYRGNVQFALAIRNPKNFDISASNGFEVDNDGNGSAKTPLTEAVFSNVTIIGPKTEISSVVDPLFKHAAQLRRNSALSIYNSVMAGFPIGLFLDEKNPGVVANAISDKLQVRNVILAGFGANALSPNMADASFKIDEWFKKGNNKEVATWQEIGLTKDIFYSTAIKTLPAANSMLLTAAKWDNATKGNNFEKVKFAGAFGTTDWTAGWCNWNPQTTVY